MLKAFINTTLVELNVTRSSLSCPATSPRDATRRHTPDRIPSVMRPLGHHESLTLAKTERETGLRRLASSWELINELTWPYSIVWCGFLPSGVLPSHLPSPKPRGAPAPEIPSFDPLCLSVSAAEQANGPSPSSWPAPASARHSDLDALSCLSLTRFQAPRPRHALARRREARGGTANGLAVPLAPSFEGLLFAAPRLEPGLVSRPPSLGNDASPCTLVGTGSSAPLGSEPRARTLSSTCLASSVVWRLRG